MSLSLRHMQTQRLALTPELRQSIQVLQLSNYDLARLLEEQTIENPLLEVVQFADFRASRKSCQTRTGERFNQQDPLTNIPKTGLTLEEHLLKQLRLLCVSPELYAASAWIAGNLDDNGYLELSVEEVCLHAKLEPELALKALLLIQQLEPAGIGARSLAECLLLQAQRDPNAPKEALPIIESMLPVLALGRLSKLAADLKVSEAQIREAAAYIRTLDPRPGLPFGNDTAQYIVPDAIVEAGPGGITITVNEAGLPKLEIKRHYFQWSSSLKDSGETAWLKERMRSAERLLHSVELRKATLIRVIEAVVEEQAGFFACGACGLQPLKLKDVAERLSLHESTVSRTVQNKYIRTPRGTFELSFFFDGGLPNEAGALTSVTHIKSRMQALVTSEPAKRPHSDQKLMELLAAEGICISRRTVAKYREELHILSSHLRKAMRD